MVSFIVFERQQLQIVMEFAQMLQIIGENRWREMTQ